MGQTLNVGMITLRGRKLFERVLTSTRLFDKHEMFVNHGFSHFEVPWKGDTLHYCQVERREERLDSIRTIKTYFCNINQLRVLFNIVICSSCEGKQEQPTQKLVNRHIVTQKYAMDCILKLVSK